MSVTTRTNRATNPSAATTATNYAAVAGTGGTAACVWNSGAGYLTIPGFPRVTWSVATTAVTGGISYTQTGLAASTQYSHQIWVRCSKVQRVVLTGTYRNSSNATVNTVTGTAVVLAANTWTQLTVTGTSGALVTNVVLTAAAVAGTSGVNWASGDWLDGEAVCIETGATPGPYFDGSFVNAAQVVYAWTGTANASTSTATTYNPTITVVAKTDAPCPRVEVTFQDLDPSTDVVNVWRTADGSRQAVRGARGRTVVGSDFVTDYEAPLGRTLSYDLEVISGVCAQAPVTTATVTVTSSTWWIQDPLVPSSAIALSSGPTSDGAPRLTAAAVKDLEYAGAVNIIPILGSDAPVALSGNRTIGGNVDFSIFTDAASASAQLRNLLLQTSLLLIRPNGDSVSAPLPGLCYYSSAKPVEQPMPTTYSGTLTHWQLTGDLVAAPTMNVLVPIWTYGTVAALWATYQQAQTTLASKTYLDVQKSPSGV